MKNLCVLCNKVHPASYWKYANYESANGVKYGWFCDKWYKPAPAKEMVPQRIQDDRNAYAKAMIQPYRDGVVSQEFIDTYGTKHVNKEEAKKAKRVWKDVLPTNWERSK